MVEDITPKTLDEGIKFNPDNIFDYLTYILCHRNANWYGNEADLKIKELNKFIESMSQDKQFEFLNLMHDTMTDISEYAYKSGFREACRLHKVLNSF